MIDNLAANLDLRRRRDEMNAHKKREQEAEMRRQFHADRRAAGLPEVRPGGH